MITWRQPAQLVHYLHALHAQNCSRFCSCRRCSGIQSAGSASASHLQAGRKKAAACACAGVRTVLYTATTRARSLAQPLLHRCLLPLATCRSATCALDMHNLLLVVREYIIPFRRAIDRCRSIAGPSSARCEPLSESLSPQSRRDRLAQPEDSSPSS